MKYFEKTLDRVMDKFTDRWIFVPRGRVERYNYEFENNSIQKIPTRVTIVKYSGFKFKNDKWRLKLIRLSNLWRRTRTKSLPD